MDTYPLSLALFDFFPTLAFLVGAIFFTRTSRLLRRPGYARMAAAGVTLVFLGGFLKAVWKLLYTTGVADVTWMSEIQFVLAAPGFLAMMVVAIAIARQGRALPAAPVMAMAAWKIPFLAVMTLCSMAVNGILTYACFQRGQRATAAAFIVSFLCLVAMGAMASSEQTLARQWTEEITNAAAQLAFAIGAFRLHRETLARAVRAPQVQTDLTPA